MKFTQTLLAWYDRHHRDLPWRHTRDPYKIWISEIIFQQTRIEQGTNYYTRFIRRFPDVKTLASAREQDVLKLWQGLGYYSRARNLYLTAKKIVQEHSGKFPSDYAEIRSLKGIGDYTAAAIASISFGLPYPVVDGNVLRFFSRYFGVNEPADTAAGKKAVLALAREMMGKADPGKFNQAVMEFGALQCIPGMPDCPACPFRETCFALSHARVADLPVKSKTARTRKRYFNYLVMVYPGRAKGQKCLLRKREEKDIWKNLYDFPMIESPGPLSQEQMTRSPEWMKLVKAGNAAVQERSKVYKHVLSHQVIYARFYLIHMKRKPVSPFTAVELAEIDNYPVPRLIDKYLTDLRIPQQTRRTPQKDLL